MTNDDFKLFKKYVTETNPETKSKFIEIMFLNQC